MLTDEEIREYYLGWIEDYCNVTFNREDLPPGVQVALMRLIGLDPQQINLGSQKLHDMSTTYNNPDDVMKLIYRDLSPYARLHQAGNKNKRRYIDGRR